MAAKKKGKAKGGTSDAARAVNAYLRSRGAFSAGPYRRYKPVIDRWLANTELLERAGVYEELTGKPERYPQQYLETRIEAILDVAITMPFDGVRKAQSDIRKLNKQIADLAALLQKRWLTRSKLRQRHRLDLKSGYRNGSWDIWEERAPLEWLDEEAAHGDAPVEITDIGTDAALRSREASTSGGPGFVRAVDARLDLPECDLTLSPAAMSAVAMYVAGIDISGDHIKSLRSKARRMKR
jgi:hypothetical protein